LRLVLVESLLGFGFNDNDLPFGKQAEIEGALRRVRLPFAST
jgi:hypothetical protein